MAEERVRAVKAIFVDVGGVVVVPNGETVAAAIGSVGASCDVGEADRAHHAGTAAIDASAHGGFPPSWAAYWAAWCLTAGMDPAYLRAALPAALAQLAVPSDQVWDGLRPGAHEGLAALAELDVPLVIVSNSDGRVEALLRRLELCQVGRGPGTPFTAILDSQVVGSTKPHPGIFLMACEAAGVDPADAVHIGDTMCMDVVGARAAGVRPVHIDPYGLAAGLDDGVDRVADLPALAALVRSTWDCAGAP